MAEEGVNRVADLTPLHVGKLVRIQTVHGAVVEGTLRGLYVEAVDAYSQHLHIHFSVKEITQPSLRGGDICQKFSTGLNMLATILED